jgi:hypothetical protein
MTPGVAGRPRAVRAARDLDQCRLGPLLFGLAQEREKQDGPLKRDRSWKRAICNEIGGRRSAEPERSI